MKRNHRIFILTAGFLVLIALAACNLPSPNNSDLEAQAGTLAAQTLQAFQTEQAYRPPTLAFTPTKARPTATITPTYSLPQVTVRESTNCRSGPGQDYPIVITYQAGTTVEILGQYAGGNYWIVKNTGGSGSCWLWGEYATPTGSTWTLPTVMPPPTQTPSPPQSPALKKFDFFCTWNGSSNDISVTMRWTDHANNESGFRIYRNGELIVELGPDVTNYTDLFAVATGVPVNYAIQAYNAAGSSGQAVFSVTCQ